MTFFEIFNKVLLELNYRAVSVFEDIYKNEHKKILDAINRVNEEVLSSFEWDFLLKKAFLEKVDTENSEDTAKRTINGRILQVYQGEKRLSYCPPTKLGEKICRSTSFSGDFYSVIETPEGVHLLVPDEKRRMQQTKILQQGALDGSLSANSNPDKLFTVMYASKDYVIKANGEYAEKMTEGDDVSTIPMPWAEHILLYGACLKVKANPAYPKFGFWNTMYIQALANLRQKSPSAAEDEPFIKIT